MTIEGFRLFLLRTLPACLFLVAWESFVRLSPSWRFFLGSPSGVFDHLVRTVTNGSLLYDAAITAIEALLGFILGNVIGTALGILLWYSKLAYLVAKPYVIALGAAPLFALAPVVVIWFGTGLFAKIVIVTLSTVFIALFQAFTGAGEADRRYLVLLRSFGASKSQVFRKAVLPSALVWVFSGLRLNIGFALLGAFIGEFISSSSGIAHMIMVASGLFDMSLVLLGVFVFMLLAICFHLVISLLEPYLKRSVIKWL